MGNTALYTALRIITICVTQCQIVLTAAFNMAVCWWTWEISIWKEIQMKPMQKTIWEIPMADS